MPIPCPEKIWSHNYSRKIRIVNMNNFTVECTFSLNFWDEKFQSQIHDIFQEREHVYKSKISLRIILLLSLVS